MLVRLIDFIKVHHITAMFTDLISGGFSEGTDVGVSSLMDSWILLKTLENNGERNRGIYVLKARGIKHSNQIREFIISSRGIDLVDVYNGVEGVLTGTARAAKEALDKAAWNLRVQETERKRRELRRKKLAIDAEIALLKSKFEAERDELNRSIELETSGEETLTRQRQKIATLRSSDEKINIKRKGKR